MNKAAERFCDNLQASIGGKFKMPTETLALYKAQLSKWRAPEDVWRRTLETIIEQNDNGDLPPLAQIYRILKQVQSDTKAASGELHAHYCYRLNGKDYSSRVWNDGGTWRLMKIVHDDSVKWHMERSQEPFAAPAGATDVHIAIPPEEQAHQGYEAMDKDAGRNWFAYGWQQSGADTVELERMFTMVSARR